jgi:hypothetical protein
VFVRRPIHSLLDDVCVEAGRAMSVTDDLEEQGWIDRLAIQDLIYRYSDSVTRADWDQCEAVFVPEAIWESPSLGMRYEGARVFREYLAEATSRSELLIQTPSAPVIQLLGPERAQATTTIHEFTRGVTVADGAYGAAGSAINFEQYGIYFDDIAKIEDAWKFTRRLFVPIYVGSDCVTGQVIGQRSGLLRPS